MNLVQHSTTAAIGFIASNEAIKELTTVPTSKGEVIALLSAVVVQSAIYGITKFFAWLKKKNNPKEVPLTPSQQPTPQL